MTSGQTRQRKETRRAQIARYKGSLADYDRELLRIVTKAGRKVPLEANFAQRHVAAKVSEQSRANGGRVRVIVLKARQEGISTWVASRVFRRIHLYRNQDALVVADLDKRGAKLFGIYDTFHRNLPADMKPRTRYSAKGKQLWYDNPAGSGLNSKVNVATAKDANAGRASTIQILHASEFAFWDNAEVTWVGLAQSIPDEESEVYIESTANGVGNLFHSMWQDAESGQSDYIAIFLPWFIHEEYRMGVHVSLDAEIRATLTPWERMAFERGIEWEGERWRLSIEQLAWRRRKIATDFRGDERGFRQEYPSTAREAFLTSGSCYFDEDVLAAYEEQTVPPTLRGNLVRHGGIIAPIRTTLGWLRVWRLPAAGGHYVIFADTAEGRMAGREREGSALSADFERGGRDFSCADVFDVTTRSFVAQLHGRMPPEILAENLAMLGTYYSSRNPDGSKSVALVGVEVNHSSGETTLRHLRTDLAYPRIFFHRMINRRNNTTTSRAGWFTTEENRDPMLSDLSASLRENSIWVPNADTIRECFTFVRDDTGKPAASEGVHDDRVIAAAGALQMARYSQPKRTVEVPKVRVADTPTGVIDYGGG